MVRQFLKIYAKSRTDDEVKPSVQIPRHVAIIMDGNGRWAKKRGESRIFGHKKGVDSVRDVVELAGEMGIEVLTLFAFSEENWGRPKPEVDFILGLLDRYLQRERAELNAKNVRFSTIGDITKLPTKSQKIVSETTRALDKNTGLNLNVALSYGARSEIVEACRQISLNVATGKIQASEIDQNYFNAHLQTSHLPPPDLLIRTSGEQRLSNFLLWQLAYTEFYFTDVHWPDFNKAEFAKALNAYSTRDRRFGKIQEKNLETAHESLTAALPTSGISVER